jgi:hypothetical protein
MADELYSEAEAARRRDEVIRRMANTPPQPQHRSTLKKAPTKARATAADLKPRKRASGRRAKP